MMDSEMQILTVIEETHDFLEKILSKSEEWKRENLRLLIEKLLIELQSRFKK